MKLKPLLHWRVLLPFGAALATIIAAGLVLTGPTRTEAFVAAAPAQVHWVPATPAIEQAIQRQERILEHVVRPAMKAAASRK